MIKATVKEVRVHKIQGIELIDAIFVTRNGIEAMCRLQNKEQVQVGQVYYGKLSYAPQSDIRIFSRGARVE